MKRIRDYWVDEEGNKWNAHLFTEEEAEAESKTLFRCVDCTNCVNCEMCSDCVNCESCYGCRHCANLIGKQLMINVKGKHRRSYLR